jgi:regulator of protease activity HflC (stomatin/prohibitin superfamily)
MKKLLITASLFAITLPLQGCLGVKIVDTGERGIETNFGKVTGEVSEGMHFYNPFTSSIITMDTRTLKWEYDDETYTKDIQQAKMHVVVNYNLDPAHASDVYLSVGHNWEQKLLPQTVQGTLKSVIGEWDAMSLIGNRAKAQAEIQERISAALADKHILVTRVEISNIDYAKEFEAAVEAKVKAIQEAEQAKNNTVRVAEEAKQAVLTAEGEAKAMQIKAQALSANANLVQYEAVQKWDGKLPDYMMGNSVPFINIAK